jgi:hypothetical protein
MRCGTKSRQGGMIPGGLRVRDFRQILRTQHIRCERDLAWSVGDWPAGPLCRLFIHREHNQFHRTLIVRVVVRIQAIAELVIVQRSGIALFMIGLLLDLKDNAEQRFSLPVLEYHDIVRGELLGFQYGQLLRARLAWR